MPDAFICDAIRTPIGRYGGALATVRTDDLAALPLKALMERNAGMDWAAVDDVVYGCANQAGEDNRNVGRMALLLAGLPVDVPGSTVNRLCGSSMDAIGIAARAIKSGEVAADDRGRRREHVARAVRARQGGQRVLARGEDRGHDDRLALRQPADEGEVRHRLDAGDRGKRRGGVQHRARRPGCVRPAQPAARGGCDRRRAARPGDRTGHAAARRRATPSSCATTSIRARRRWKRSRS